MPNLINSLIKNKDKKKNTMLLVLPLILSILFYILKEKEIYLILGLFSLIILLLQSFSFTLEILFILFLTFITLIWITLNEQKLIAIFISFSSYLIIISTSLISLFIGLELLSFSIIILVNLYSKDKYISLLYFIFNAILSAILILSIGYFYLGYSLGMKFFLLALICKIGLPPFHILLPQLYNNLSPKIIILIDLPYKLTLFFILLKFNFFSYFSNSFLLLILIISLLIGSIGTLYLKNLFSILVYSSLYNNGLILILIFFNSTDYFLYYLFIYGILIYIYLSLITFKTFEFLSFYNPYYLIIWILLLFNLMGIPPLSGFFIKLNVFYLTLYHNSFFLFFILLITTLIITFVYLRLIKTLFLQEKVFILKNQNSFSSHILAFLITFISFPLFF